jgi:hypothetical protein
MPSRKSTPFTSLYWCLSILFPFISPVCETDGYAIRTDKLVGTSLTPTSSLKDPKAEGLYDVLCGSSLTQVVDALEKDGRALMNLGGFTGLCYYSISCYCH